MEKTRMLVLCVYLTFMSLSYIEELNSANATVTSNNTDSSGTTPTTSATTHLPGHTSTHVTSNSSNITTIASSTSAVSSNSTASITSAQTTSMLPGATSSTSQRPPTEAKTTKGGSASLMGSCSHLLVPVVSVLIYCAEG